MAFRFPLETVLRLRASFERLEHLRLLSLQAIVVRLRQEIDSFDAQSLRFERSQRERLTEGTPAADLQFEATRMNTRVLQKRSLEAHLAELMLRHQKQQLVYLAARQKREILENLRLRKWSEYRREQARREQQQMDELFLLTSAAKLAE
jgi:flagellar export protein FliJ